MTESTTLMQRLVEAYPAFLNEWRQHTSSDLYEPGEPHNDVGRLATFMVSQLQIGDTTGFDELFDVIESLLDEGSQETREVIVVGFIETLQNVSLNNTVDLIAWRSWLGPQTWEAWQKVVGLWNGSVTPDDFNRYVGGER